MHSLPHILLRANQDESAILVSPGLASRLGKELRSRTAAHKVILVTDSTVGPLHAPKVIASLEASDFQVVTYTLPAGEHHKHIETLLPAYTALLSANIDRGTPLLALGGGVTGDMAGMLAGTLLRGLPFVQIPTTLMAMVDSAIGGKTGVNHPAGKNLIGVFHQPFLVAADPELLATLPEPELRNGLAECIKHDIIRDPAHFALWPELLPEIIARDTAALAALVHHNAAIKSAVVTEDPHEHGVRAHLNLGHTFAHAIETVTNHATPHGQAVALGLCAAATLSQNLNLLPEETATQIIATIAAAGLPTGGIHADPTALVAAMRKDKKVEHGHLRFVLLKALGQPVVRADVPESAVREAFATILN